MESSTFYQEADALFSSLEDALEEADAKETLILERTQDGLSVEIGAHTFVLSRHAPSAQIWFASPLSGGFYFSHDSKSGTWRTASGGELRHIVEDELCKASGNAIAAGMLTL